MTDTFTPNEKLTRCSETFFSAWVEAAEMSKAKCHRPMVLDSRYRLCQFLSDIGYYVSGGTRRR